MGVNNKEGIFDAYTQKGKEINQAYKKMKVGWLAYNPYRINVGSIGIRLQDHKNEYISPAYVVFSCNDILLPEYLFLVFKTQSFNKVINESTTGSVRQNLTIDILKKLQIPLPNIEVQKKIVADYKTKINQSEYLREKSNSVVEEVEEYLFSELGITHSIKTASNSFIQTVDFIKIERWNVDFIMNNTKLSLVNSSKYPVVKLRYLILRYQYGLSAKATKENVGIPMLRMNNIYRSFLVTEDLKYIPNSDGISNYFLKKGDLLFNGSSETPEEVGMCSVLLKEFPELYLNSFCFGFRLKKELKNDALFLSYYFRSKQGRKLFYSLAQGATRYNLSKSNFLQLEIHLPEPDEQKAIAVIFSDMDSEIETLQQQLSKYKLIKEGMMQNLLTGRVRLV